MSPSTSEEMPEKVGHPKIWQIVLIATVAIVFTTIFLEGYLVVNGIIWENGFVKTNRWIIPVIVVFFSFLVGVCLKYFKAPDVIHGNLTDSMKGEEAHSDYRIFPGTLLSAFFSLVSGVSVGPEGPIAILVMEISAWFREKLKIINEVSIGFDVAALASAYNGIIGNPLFSAVIATEFNVGNKNALKFIAWNLLAGVIGFLLFKLFGFASFASFMEFPPIGTVTPMHILYAVILGVLGAGVAVAIGAVMRGVGQFTEKVFHGRVMERVLFAGVIMGIVCTFIPELLFSGESSIHGILKEPAMYGAAFLLLMAVLKIVFLALSFKSGFLGGPIFPTIFACTMISLALSLVFPGIPLGILVLCLEVAVITCALGIPLTAILLVGVIGNTDPLMLSLLVISSTVALVLGMAVREMKESPPEGNSDTPGQES